MASLKGSVLGGYSILGVAVALIFTLSLVVLSPEFTDFTGFTLFPEEVVMQELLLAKTEYVPSDTPYTIPFPIEDVIKSVTVSGTVYGEGTIKIVLRSGKNEWTVFERDTTAEILTGSPITGMVVGNESAQNETAAEQAEEEPEENITEENVTLLEENVTEEVVSETVANATQPEEELGLNVTEAEENATEPVEEPELNITEPEENVTEPEINVTEPPEEPEVNITEPEENITEPETNVTIPEENVTVPEENVTIPEINITEPEEEPEINITEPEVNITEPEENITEPETNVTIPEENVTVPEENVTLPEENITEEIVSEPAVFTFTDTCIETCTLPSVEKAELVILIEGNTTLELTSVKYDAVIVPEEEIPEEDEISKILGELGLIGESLTLRDVSIIMGLELTQEDKEYVLDMELGHMRYSISLDEKMLKKLRPGVLDYMGRDPQTRVIVNVTKDAEFLMVGDFVERSSLEGKVKNLKTISAEQFRTEYTRLDILHEKNIFLDSGNGTLFDVEQVTDKYVSVTVDTAGLEALLKSGVVEEVLPDKQFFASIFESALITETDYAYGSGYWGTGKSICVVDTGLNISTLGLTDGVDVFGYNFIDDNNNYTDEHGHGTMVTTPIRYFAPNVTIYVAKVIDEMGKGYSSDIVEALEWCGQNGADVVSISLSEGRYEGYCDFTIVAQKVNELSGNGTVVVAATGNNLEVDKVSNPACASGAIRVAASEKIGKFWMHSNFNNATLILAPGHNILTKGKDGTWVNASGTSMSAAMVSAIAAIILENRTMSPGEMNDTLIQTGDILYYNDKPFSVVNARNALLEIITNNLTEGPVGNSSYPTWIFYTAAGIDDPCTYGSECNPNICVAGFCRYDCDYDETVAFYYASGRGCSPKTSSTSWTTHSTCIDSTPSESGGIVACITGVGTVRMNCGTSCTIGSSDATYSTCTTTSGDSCDSTRGGNFVQNGVCATGATYSCDTSGEVAYCSSAYYDDCSDCSSGDRCDSAITSGGDYASNGICVSANCDTGEVACSGYGSTCGALYFASCASGGASSRGCDANVGTVGYQLDGVCTETANAGTINLCCDGSGKDVAGASNADTSPQDYCPAEDSSSPTAGFTCDTNALNGVAGASTTDAGVWIGSSCCTSGFIMGTTSTDDTPTNSCSGTCTVGMTCLKKAYYDDWDGKITNDIYKGICINTAGGGGGGGNDDGPCDQGEVTYYGGQYYYDCISTSSAYGAPCDSDVFLGADGYVTDGVCGAASHGACCTNYGSDADNSNAPSICGTIAAVCDNENTYYCDSVSDGSWSPGDKRCDASDDTCRTCYFATHTDSESLCESGCGADGDCDEKSPSAYTGSCTYGSAVREDYCSSTCVVSDGTCESGCGASADCDENNPNTCSNGAPPDGYCSTCTYQASESTANACRCDVCGTDNSAAPGSCAVPNDPWDAGNWPGDINQKCCEDDAGEVIWYRNAHFGDIGESGFVDDSADDACCNLATDCVYSGSCFAAGVERDPLGVGRGTHRCYGSGPGSWINTDYHSSYCSTYEWDVGSGDATGDSYAGSWGGNSVGYCRNQSAIYGGSFVASKHCCCGDDANEYYMSCSTDATLPDSGGQTCDAADDACCNVATDCVTFGATRTCVTSGTHATDADGSGDHDYCDSGTWRDCSDTGDCDPTGEEAVGDTGQPCIGSSECNEACTGNDCIYKRYNGWSDCDAEGACVSGNCMQDAEYAGTADAGVCDSADGCICNTCDTYDTCIPATGCPFDNDWDEVMADCHGAEGGLCYASSGDTNKDVDNDGDNDYCSSGTWYDCNTDTQCPSGYYCSANDCAVCTSAQCATHPNCRDGTAGCCDAHSDCTLSGDDFCFTSSSTDENEQNSPTDDSDTEGNNVQLASRYVCSPAKYFDRGTEPSTTDGISLNTSYSRTQTYVADENWWQFNGDGPVTAEEGYLTSETDYCFVYNYDPCAGSDGAMAYQNGAGTRGSLGTLDQGYTIPTPCSSNWVWINFGSGTYDNTVGKNVLGGSNGNMRVLMEISAGDYVREWQFGWRTDEAGDTDGSNSYWCCDDSTDCVDDAPSQGSRVLGDPDSTSSGCYNTGSCHDTGSTASTDEYCNSGTWIDNDDSESACKACEVNDDCNADGDTQCWDASEAACCGDDGASDDWCDTGSASATTTGYCLNGDYALKNTDDDETACLCMLNDGMGADECDTHGESGCWDTTAAECCGDDGASDDWVGTEGVCHNGYWYEAGAGTPCDQDTDCPSDEYCVLESTNDQEYSCSRSFICQSTNSTLGMGTWSGWIDTDGSYNYCGDRGFDVPYNGLCVRMDVLDGDAHADVASVEVNQGVDTYNPASTSPNNWYDVNFVHQFSGATTSDFLQAEIREWETSMRIMMGYFTTEAGDTSGGAGGDGCCDDSNDCVWNSTNGHLFNNSIVGNPPSPSIPEYVYGCYDDGNTTDVGGGDGSGDDECCNAGTWEAADASQTCCATDLGLSWLTGGESSGFGGYATGSETECCEDDSGENIVDEQSYSTGDYSMVWDNDENHCCNASDRCNAGGTCYTGSASPGPQTEFSGLNPGADDDMAYCYNSGGDGRWLDCDRSDYMDYWCGSCGPGRGGISPRSGSYTANASWNAAASGESSDHGEYNSTDQSGGILECCGDDDAENYIVCATDATLPDSGGQTCDASADTHDDSCCNMATDCVTFNGSIYCAATGTHALDADNDGDKDYCGGSNTWSDCNTDAGCDTSNGYYCDTNDCTNSCSVGDDCPGSFICVNGYCRASCDTYSGRGCSDNSESYATRGTCYDEDGTFGCDTTDEIRMDCSAGGCDAEVDKSYATCTTNSGDSCMSNVGGDFSQDGTCAEDATNDCDTSGEVIKDGSTYYDDCTNHVGAECDTDATSDGDYGSIGAIMGYCLSGGTCDSGCAGSPSGDQFKITDSGDSVVATIDESGDMFVDGNVYESQGSLSPPAGSFIVQNVTGDVVAYISDSGDLYLQGTVTTEDVTGLAGYNLEVRDSSDTIVAWFDDEGNLRLAGCLVKHYSG